MYGYYILFILFDNNYIIYFYNPKHIHKTVLYSCRNNVFGRTTFSRGNCSYIIMILDHQKSKSRDCGQLTGSQN